MVRRCSRAQRLLQVLDWSSTASPVSVRSATGAEASEVSADQRCSLVAGSDGHAFAVRIACQPFGRPGAFGGVVDPRQRLQGTDASAVAFGKARAAAEILPVTAHGERGRADRATEIEGEDLGAVAAELQRHQRQQHRLARAVGPTIRVWPTSPT
jgi:hypothetical protein